MALIKFTQEQIKEELLNPMLPKKSLYFLLLLTIPLFSQANNDKPTHKNFIAERTTSRITVDGLMNEKAWKKISCTASNFVQRRPNPGQPSTLPTEVRVLYDNSSVYVFAQMHDSNPDSILTELTRRDNRGITDFFAIYFDTFNDDLNAFEFMVTAAGVQIDVRRTPVKNDRSWNAAWYSEVVITDDGWQVEMEIPLSAIRFPEAPVQEWGVNFRRMIRRKNESSYWNAVNPEVNGFVNQFGRMHGIFEVDPPLRLSISPYVSAYVNSFVNDEGVQQTSLDFNGGMDIRYGISDAYTLDMILIPDFGQVVSDNQVLNLSPFEVQFDENRQFFKEGTELFDKGGFFYSRRIGGRPLAYGDVEDQLRDGEEIVSNPTKSKLINATKITGRDNNGLGIGVFNAVTQSTFATVENESGEQREVMTDPFTNYSVLAVDKSLKNNSFVSVVNTNVTRWDTFYNANVTGTSFRFADADNQYELNGRAALSAQYGYQDQENIFGYTASLGIAKVGGNFRAGIRHNIESDTYDINDLGFLRANNESTTRANVGYRIFQPFLSFMNANIRVSARYSRWYNPNEFNRFELSSKLGATLQNFWYVEVGNDYAPFSSIDYNEPRVDGRFFRNTAFNRWKLLIRTDDRERFTLRTFAAYRSKELEDAYSYFLLVKPSFRVDNHLTVSSEIRYDNNHNEVGYVTDSENEITFGRRQRNFLDNRVNVKYTFNNQMDLSFRMRHYWSTAAYDQFFSLEENGTLGASEFFENEDRNYNAFNIDMIYTYVFAPASELSIVWKNNLVEDGEEVFTNYLDNVNNLFNLPQNNSISVRVLYFLDYSMMAKKLRNS